MHYELYELLIPLRDSLRYAFSQSPLLFLVTTGKGAPVESPRLLVPKSVIRRHYLVLHMEVSIIRRLSVGLYLYHVLLAYLRHVVSHPFA